MKVAKPLAKNVLAPLGLTAAMSAIAGSIQKKIHGSGVQIIIEQEDIKDIMKIIKALKNSGILLKGVSKTFKNETKEQRGGLLWRGVCYLEYVRRGVCYKEEYVTWYIRS